MATSKLVELKLQNGESSSAVLSSIEADSISGLKIDTEYEPVIMHNSEHSTDSTCIIRVIISDEFALDQLKKHPCVLKIWKDTPIAGFEGESNNFGF